MTMPNFLIIGAPRSGTTSLHRYLQEHPQIYMSPLKELRFFAFEGQTVKFKGPGDAYEFNQQTITDLTSYQNQFRGVTDEIAIGETSPIYLWWPNTAERIYQTLPEVKLIAIFRNPIERAYSDFLNMRRLKWEPLADFSQALAQEAERIEKGWGPFYQYQRKGFYFSNLQSYFPYFKPHQIQLYFYEDLRNHPQTLLQDIFKFLGVDENFSPNLEKVYNASRPWEKWVNQVAILKSLFSPPPLTSETRQQLIELYRTDILNLQDLTGRDLSHWLQ